MRIPGGIYARINLCSQKAGNIMNGHRKQIKINTNRMKFKNALWAGFFKSRTDQAAAKADEQEDASKKVG